MNQTTTNMEPLQNLDPQRSSLLRDSVDAQKQLVAYFQLCYLSLTSGLDHDLAVAATQASVEKLEFYWQVLPEFSDAILTIVEPSSSLSYSLNEMTFLTKLSNALRFLFTPAPSSRCPPIGDQVYSSGAETTFKPGFWQLQDRRVRLAFSLKKRPVGTADAIAVETKDARVSALSLLLLPQKPAPALLLSVGSIYLEVDIPSPGEAPTSAGKSPCAHCPLSAKFSSELDFQTRARIGLDLEFCHLKTLKQLAAPPSTKASSPLLAYFARKSSSLERHVYGDLLILNDFSLWCHNQTIGFRASNLQGELSSNVACALWPLLPEHPPQKNRHHAFPNVNLRGWKLDGCLERLHLFFVSSRGPFIKLGVEAIQCLASPVPRCSPSRSTSRTSVHAAVPSKSEHRLAYFELSLSKSWCGYAGKLTGDEVGEIRLEPPPPPPSQARTETAEGRFCFFSLPPFQVSCFGSEKFAWYICLHNSAATEIVFESPNAAHELSLVILDLNILINRTSGRRELQALSMVISCDKHNIFLFQVGISIIYDLLAVVPSLSDIGLFVILFCQKIALLWNPPADAHRKWAVGLSAQLNSSIEFHIDHLRATFPYKYNFYACYDEFLKMRKMSNLLTSEGSNLFEDINNLSGLSAHVKESEPGLRRDLILRLKKFTLELKDDPFECKLCDDFVVLLDEYVEQQKRLTSMRTQLENAAKEGMRLSELQRADEYIARLRRFYVGYEMADDLFTWRMENVCLQALTDPLLIGPANVLRHLREMDSVSPWGDDVLFTDFLQCWCRMIQLNLGRCSFNLRDYPKPLLNITGLSLTGRLGFASRKADWLGQQDYLVEPGPPWPSLTVVRHMTPNKFFYDFNADMRELSVCYGANWEPTFAWLNLRLDDIRRTSQDPSKPPLGWWDRIRLNYHGRLFFACGRMVWLYPTSLDPYNSVEFLTWQWSHVTVTWLPGQIDIRGDLDVFFQTASKYDGVCPLLRFPELIFRVDLDWLSHGNQYDHLSVKPVNPARLGHIPSAVSSSCVTLLLHAMRDCRNAVFSSLKVPHDSFKQFRGNRLNLRISFLAQEVHNDTRPRCFIYTNVLKLFDRLKMCLTRVSRPIRKGAVFSCIKPKKPLFGQLLQNIEVLLQLPSLDITYWVSYAKRMGLHIQAGEISCSGCLQLHVEGETEVPLPASLPSVLPLPPSVFILPPRDTLYYHRGLCRRPPTSWSCLKASATALNCRIWLQHSDTQTAIEFLGSTAASRLSGTEERPDSAFVAEFDLPQDYKITTAFPPNTEFIIVSLVRFERACPVPLPFDCTVRVRIPRGCEALNSSTAGTRDDSTAYPNSAPSLERKLSVSASLEENSAARRRFSRFVLTHEDLQPVNRVEVREFRMRWNEENRNLVYSMMNMYNHAQTLKKNLSAQALKSISLQPGVYSEHGAMVARTGGPQFRGVSETDDVDGRRFPSLWPTTLCSADATTSPEESEVIYSRPQSPTRAQRQDGGNGSVDGCSSAQRLVDTATGPVDGGSLCEQGSATPPTRLTDIPMLAQLVEEAETAKFYAYCEEVMLKPTEFSGYLIVSAAKARLDLLEHPPVWRDARLLAKFSLVGQMDCMQYYATVGQVRADTAGSYRSLSHLCTGPCLTQLDASTPDQWLSTADVSDWSHLGTEFSQDALSGRPEVVGSGHAVGGIVNAACDPTIEEVARDGGGCGGGGTAAVRRPIQLQRMVGRCACQFFYVTYNPVDPASLPPPQMVPPLRSGMSWPNCTESDHISRRMCNVETEPGMVPFYVCLFACSSDRNPKAEKIACTQPLEETEIMQNPEGANTFTLLHRTLNMCTNSMQYNMVFDIVNDLLLYVEPQQKERSERNRVGLSLLDEPQLKVAILRDQESLRSMVNYQRQSERELWSMLREVDQKLHGLSTAVRPSAQTSCRFPPPVSTESAGAALLARFDAGELPPALAHDLSNILQGLSCLLKFAYTPEHGCGALPLIGPVSSPSRADCSSDTPSATASLQDAAGSVQPPAEIVRRDEVCFEHAHWRMTENDGQIGLADVELRGYIYARTHRRDDSGSHWCELGWVRVSSLAPNSFYKEVLVPDTSSDHYTGGPVLRIYCTQRPPVGAIAVCEVMEISIAPFVLQVSKHFYNLMMPFFFPDRAPDANTTTGDRTTEDGASGVLPVVPSKVDITPVPNDSALSRAERLPDAADADSSRSFNTTRREKSKKNLPRILPSPISDISHSAYGTGSRFSRFRNRKDRLDVPVSAASPENPPPTGIEIGQADLTVDDVLSNHGEGLGVELVIPQDSSGTAATSLAPSHASFTDKLSRPLSDKAGSVASSSTAADRPRGQFPAPSSAAQEVFASASTVGFGGQSVKAASTAIAPLDAVEVMRVGFTKNRHPLLLCYAMRC
ncbi:unnamed protein product [Schistocephalus solidus]|uniref:Fmp27_GFWDK domain-containing protein n=1 Tax=Schistocephalus solidus TaxID=70667 RepID=A0A183T0R1_SCHSO|nr:unnamed protein product [Schistocephalus solidus]